jgi:mono/diheme cytochrome c family protein
VRALYLTQCASCHGEEGHGDGPMAAMFRPADLASQPVQSKSDEELTRVIVQGRNRMPAFGDRLPPDSLPLLVRLIRSFR